MVMMMLVVLRASLAMVALVLLSGGGVILASRSQGERSRRLQNVSQTIEELLNGYDIRLRPQFGGTRRKVTP